MVKMAAAGELVPEDLEDTLAAFGSSLDNLDALLQPLILADFFSLQVHCVPDSLTLAWRAVSASET